MCAHPELPPPDPDRARRIARQHLTTLHMLGVDVAPVRPPDVPSALPLGATEPASNADLPASQIEGKPGASSAALPTLSAPRNESADGHSRAVYTPVELPAGELTREAATELLEQVRAAYARDMPHRAFNQTHDNIVFGEGDPRAGMMFVGEAPGETEDKTGRPFVGRAGQLLDKMIKAIGLEREQTYICNVLKVRPPNNATPTPEEATASAPYLLDQIRIVRPRVIVTLGLPATRLLLDTTQPMRALRGVFSAFPPPSFGTVAGLFSGPWEREPIPVMPTYHPAYLLRSYTEDNRRKVWEDLKAARAKLDDPD